MTNRGKGKQALSILSTILETFKLYENFQKTMKDVLRYTLMKEILTGRVSERETISVAIDMWALWIMTSS